MLIFGFLTWGQVRGQLILSKDENKIWVDKIRQEKSLAVQLDILRNRILTDTNVYVKPLVHTYVLKTEGDKNKSDGLCKPVIIVDGKVVAINNGTSTKKIKTFAAVLTADNIKSMEIATDDRAVELYGSQGECGLIILTAKSRKIRKSLLKINK